jgi:aromatic ring-opening dioxygenase LigB subunit
MKIVAVRLVGTCPEAVVVISPHSPRKPAAFGLWRGNRLQRSFSRFGAADVAVDLPNDLKLAEEIETQARGFGLRIWDIRGQPLDHGSLVPLYYLVTAGWTGPTTVLSLNYPGEGGLTELGHAVAIAAMRLELRVAFVASGDMSHRLTLDSSAGYNPRARDFDDTFIACLRRGSLQDLKQLDSDLQELAAEDAVDSTIVAAAATNWATTGHNVLSYEGPFGVGYVVAVLFDSKFP